MNTAHPSCPRGSPARPAPTRSLMRPQPDSNWGGRKRGNDGEVEIKMGGGRCWGGGGVGGGGGEKTVKEEW